MASCVAVVDLSGNSLIYRAYRGDVQREKVLEAFQERVLLAEESEVAPVFEHDGYTFMYIRENNVYLLTVSSINCIPLLHIEYMRRCVKVFEVYCSKVTELSVRDNFGIIYELLDEMCDFGYPQFTEERVLKQYITQEGLLSFLLPDESAHKKAIPDAVTGVGTPWRPEKAYLYSRNEVFLDVCERVNMLMNCDGTPISSEILGVVRVKSRLSGTPVMQVCLNDKAMYDISGQSGAGVDLEDIQFHQCVNLQQFEKDRIISCVPPDGKFDLLTYRINRKLAPLVVVRCSVQAVGTSRVCITCIVKAAFRHSVRAKTIDVHLPIPSDADSPVANCTSGAVRYKPETNKAVWSLREMAGGREANCSLQFHLPSIRSSESSATEKAPVEVHFEIPYLAASGFQVRYVKIKERSLNYDAVPWVRYLTESGEYYSRTVPIQRLVA